jgi:1-acyl-sn-glycerol-3-phosphate acyltransferase
MIFWLLFVTWTITAAVGGITLAIFQRQALTGYIGGIWGRPVILFLKYFLGVDYKISGEANIPKHPFIIACKHESAWETIFLLSYFGNPAFILKRELRFIPFYGWVMPMMGMVAIDRKAGKQALAQTVAGSMTVLKQNRVLIIFPEGRRVPPNTAAPLKPGIFMIRQASPEVNILPVYLNSGKFWPKGSFLIYPGVINVHFHPTILDKQANNKEEWLQKLEKIINSPN